LRGTQLVTGGRGAIGTQLVEWLIAKGAPKVVSASRQLPDAAEQQRLAALASQRSVQLEFAAIDITDAAEVQSLVAAIDTDTAHSLRGIFHAAGTLEDGLLAMQPAASLLKVMAPKVAGTLNLHRASLHVPLDHFVSFSSIVSCIGSPGQCAYAAANAYVDALSLQRNAEGLPAHVVNWGLWAGRGMAEQLDARQLRRIEAVGMKPLEPESALLALEGLMGRREGQSLVWRVDVDTLLASGASRALRPLLADLSSTTARDGAHELARAPSGLGNRLRALPSAERRAALTDHLVGELAATLQVPRDRASPHTPLIEMGLDSLMAAEFRSAIRSELDVDISFGRLLEGATLHDIVGTIVGKLDGPAEAPVPGPVRQRETQHLDAVSAEATFDVEMESGQL
jgi:NADP-dependent 3-hydroxy acid dehydrogenase YdfG/acyl carrier protein